MRFFHPSFLNAQGIVAQKIYNVRAFLVNFMTLKVGTIPTAKCPLVSGEPQRTGISRP